MVAVFPYPNRHSSGPALQALRLIRGELAEARGAVAVVVLLGVLSAMAETAGVGMVLLLLSVMFRSAEAREAADAESEGMLDRAVNTLVGWFDGNVALAAALLVALILLRLGIVVLQGVVTSRVTADVAHRTRTRLFAACMAIPLLDLRRRSWGDLYTTVEQHSGSVPDCFDAACSMLRELIVLLALGLLLLWLAPVLATTAVVSLLLISGLLRLVEGPVRQAGEDIATGHRAIADILIRTFQAIRTYRAFGFTPTQIERFAAASRKAADAEHRHELLASVTEPASHVSALLAVMIMALVAGLTSTGAATLVLAVGLLYRLQPYVAALDANRLFLAERLPSLIIVHDALQAGEAPRATGQAVPQGSVPIRLDKVHFRYPGAGHAVIEDLSLEIAARGWTYVVGKSGAGKSTLGHLLLGLFDPDSGTISVGDTALDAIARDDWRRQLALCGQETELVHGSIRDNILLGNPAADDALVDRAIAVAGLDGVLAILPHGLDTVVGEQGSTLSGGQRQRVGIARALVRQPRLLILDEATSALDRASQHKVVQAIEQEMRDRAVLVIGHQLDWLPPSTIRYRMGVSA